MVLIARFHGYYRILGFLRCDALQCSLSAVTFHNTRLCEFPWQQGYVPRSNIACRLAVYYCHVKITLERGNIGKSFIRPPPPPPHPLGVCPRPALLKFALQSVNDSFPKVPSSLQHTNDRYAFYEMRFQVLAAANVKVTVFWDVALCSLVQFRRHFGGTLLLHNSSP
jgi:hypothetical protein